MQLEEAIALLEFSAVLAVFGYVLVAVGLLSRRQRARARLMLAQGALLGLSVLLAATLLKFLLLGDWESIAMLAVFIGLRSLLKWSFAHQSG